MMFLCAACSTSDRAGRPDDQAPVSDNGAAQQPVTASPQQSSPSSWLAAKGRYKPAGDPFPQIIQASDYETIQAIESLYAAIIRTGGADSLRDVSREPLQISASDTAIVLTSSVTETSMLVADAVVTIDGTAYTAPATVTLFKTLRRVLLDAGGAFPATGAKVTQYQTRAYQKLTTIEFGYGPVVVSLVGLSNGPANTERLYVLDAVASADSLLWRRPGSR